VPILCASKTKSKTFQKGRGREKNLGPLDLIHLDLREMNGILTKLGKRYFFTFIDDATHFFYAYLSKTKDETLN
jgi:hypothetical protein